VKCVVWFDSAGFLQKYCATSLRYIHFCLCVLGEVVKKKMHAFYLLSALVFIAIATTASFRIVQRPLKIRSVRQVERTVTTLFDTHG